MAGERVFTIRKNSDRYPGIDRLMPESFQVIGMTQEQAEELADRLSNWNPGCDFAYYVEGGEGDGE